jgi:N-acyl-D-amino-acid deacylase
MKRAVSAALLLTLFAGCSDPGPGGPSGTLIGNVRIVDGTGAPAFTGAVRIVAGRLAAVGDAAPQPGDTRIDGAGWVLAPGFIDTHSHADGDIFEHPDALAAVSQGITTVVVGQDGGSPFPLAGFAARLETADSAVNFASYVGHNTIRERVMGDDYERAASPAEVDEMRGLLLAEMNAGALGLATGLEYDPGIYSDAAEVLALAQAAADAGGRYISHLRSEDRSLDAAIAELLDIGRATGMPVQISHMKLAMKSLWGRAPDILARLDEARTEGVDVTADVYPYEYWQSTMMVLLPERDPNDREAVRYALEELAPPDGMWLTRFEPNPDYVGMTLTEVAALRETDPVTTFQELALEALEMAERTGRRAEQIIGTSMDGRDIAALLAWEHSNVCTDGSLVDLHPRGAGSFPRVLGRYVREQGLLSLEDAVRKMSGLAADHMGLDDRGYIRIGQAADLVLFDPDRIADRATAEQPGLLSTGIERVFVGGVEVFAHGKATGARPGRFIRREAQP